MLYLHFLVQKGHRTQDNTTVCLEKPKTCPIFTETSIWRSNKMPFMSFRKMCICVCSFLKSKMNTWGLRTRLPYAIKNSTWLKENTKLGAAISNHPNIKTCQLLTFNSAHFKFLVGKYWLRSSVKSDELAWTLLFN